MFTGIIQAIGKVREPEPLGNGVRLTICAPDLGLDEVRIGDSIAVNGACMTVVDKLAGGCYLIDVSDESLRCTAGLDQAGRKVNLEKAMRLGDMLGGHLVSGHVDGVGEVLRFDAVGDNRLLEIRAPQDIAKFIARKGSIVVDGTSLTTNSVNGADFTINLIPHTLENTTLNRLKPGSKVNLEVDLIARYCERLLTAERE